MQDLSSLVQMLALFIGAVSTAWATTHKTNKKDYAEIIKELKLERDEYKQRCQILQAKLDKVTDKLIRNGGGKNGKT